MHPVPEKYCSNAHITTFFTQSERLAEHGSEVVSDGGSEQDVGREVLPCFDTTPEWVYWFKHRHGRLFRFAIVRRFQLRRWHVSDRLEQPAVLEPVDPFQGRELEGFKIAPRSSSAPRGE